MATVKREGDNVYIQHADKMRYVGKIIAGLRPGEPVPLPAILVVDRDRDKHLMRNWNAYGFAKEVIDHKDWFSFLQVNENAGSSGTVYLVPREDVILHGRDYEVNGFERQYFVSLERLENYKI